MHYETILKASKLLSDFSGSEYVYLLPRGYVENWVIWAKRIAAKGPRMDEHAEINKLLNQVQSRYKMKNYSTTENFSPAPIDCSSIFDGKDGVSYGYLKPGLDPSLNIVAVPEKFYDFIRVLHGVLCRKVEGSQYSNISFQPHYEGCDMILIGGTSDVSSDTTAIPLEYRRKIIEKSFFVGAKNCIKIDDEHFVELYHMSIDYRLLTASNASVRGTLLASCGVSVKDACVHLCKLLAPELSISCIRIWYPTRISPSPTKVSDGYEVIDVNLFSEIRLREWRGIELLVETRESLKQSWPREELELVNRLQVGDFVDAQDSAGKWYEAVVQEIYQDTITVHFFGWSSRWDAKLSKDYSTEVVRKGYSATTRKGPPPEPLWSHTKNWRDTLKEGDFVEVREASSSIRKPKWFCGRIIRFNYDSPYEIKGGAELELNDKVLKKELLLLRRTTQILVEVDDEKQNLPHEISGRDDDVMPPYRRWVYLYGEEVCQINTHRKDNLSKKSEIFTPVMVKFGNVKEDHLKIIHDRGYTRGVPLAPGSVGLANLGNTCYFNAIVQCVLQIPLLVNYFIRNEFEQHLNKYNPLGSGGRIANAFSEFVSEVWSNDYTVVSPRLLRHSIGLFAPQFANSHQHDAQELYSVLLDGLHEDTNKIKEKPYVDMDISGNHSEARRAMITWQKHIKRHDSIIVDHFQGLHKSHLTCIECSHESIKFDIYSCLSLPIPPMLGKGKVPLSACFDEFQSSEQLDEENAWFCPNCKKLVRAKKLLRLWSTPDILVIHLKRFGSTTSDNSSKKRGTRNGSNTCKIIDVIDFPVDKLDLSNYVSLPGKMGGNMYKLFGVTEHQGGSANSGHYTATVRNCKSEGQWYKLNDTNVGASTGDTAINSGAYVLFYERISEASRKPISQRWGGMEDYMRSNSVDPYVEESDQVDDDGFVHVSKPKKKTSKR